MDDTDLRTFIQTLTKTISPTNELKDFQEDTFKRLLESEETVKIDDKIRAMIDTHWPLKDGTVASRNRKDGDEAINQGKFELAVLLYTESLRYQPLSDLTNLEDLDFAECVANRSLALHKLGRFEECLADIDLAILAGYPKETVFKLHIRRCKCLLELGRVRLAQNAFEEAMKAIEESGLNQGSRRDMTEKLQLTFAALATSMDEDGVRDEDDASKNTIPDYLQIQCRNVKYPAASEAVSVRYNDTFGRHTIATRDIKVGEVLFVEEPIVDFLMQEDDPLLDACSNCFAFISEDKSLVKKSSLSVPCPTCMEVVFCSVQCRNKAYESYHKYECQLGPVLRSTKLHRVPLVMMALRAITQKDLNFFLDLQGDLQGHNLRNGVEGEDDQVFLSADYRNLFNLVTHSERRDQADLAAKAVFAVFLVKCLELVGYFKTCAQTLLAHAFISRLLFRFLQCFQFNTHMIECIYINRLIAQDAEIRIWKNSNKFLPGEFVETVRLGGGIFPTLANVNHSCDPNIILVNWGKTSVAVANRPINQGEQIFDTYGAVFYHMNLEERQSFLQRSHWFKCTCLACNNDWPVLSKLPRNHICLINNLKINTSNLKLLILYT